MSWHAINTPSPFGQCAVPDSSRWLLSHTKHLLSKCSPQAPFKTEMECFHCLLWKGHGQNFHVGHYLKTQGDRREARFCILREFGPKSLFLSLRKGKFSNSGVSWFQGCTHSKECQSSGWCTWTRIKTTEPYEHSWTNFIFMTFSNEHVHQCRKTALQNLHATSLNLRWAIDKYGEIYWVWKFKK